MIKNKLGGFSLLPCAPGVCSECAADHPADQPHNRDSLYYQYKFYGQHGRWPTWIDAMEHCDEDMRAAVSAALKNIGKI